MGAFRARALTHPLNLPPPHRRLPSIPPCHSHAATSARHPGIVIPPAQRAESWECQHAGLAASILRSWPGQRCLPRPAARHGESALPGEGLAPCHHHGPPAGHRECPPTPQGQLGRWLAPMAPSKPFPGSSLSATAWCRKAHFQCTETHQNPPKHPKILPHHRHPEPGMSPSLRFTKTLGFSNSPTSTSSRAPVGKGQEPGGIPPAPQVSPGCQVQGQGREQMVPLGTAARHSTGQLGMERHGTAPPAAMPRSGQGSPATLPPARRVWASPGPHAGRARTVPCHPSR